VFFAGGNADSVTSGKKGRPGVGWFIQAYHVLTRAMRKRIQRLYIVHERKWVRVLVEVFSSIASPKFRKKIVHGTSYFAELRRDTEALIFTDSFYSDTVGAAHRHQELTCTTVSVSERSRCLA
jgi:Rho GTPase-activating protein 1